VGDGNSSVADSVGFFLGEEVADGAGDSFSRDVEDFLGVGVGVGDFFFVAAVLFFFRGLGVGVGVEKIFLIVSPGDRSVAGDGTGAITINTSAIRILINITFSFDASGCDSLERRFWQYLAYPVTFRP
jgi:hypothetical protein